ncbi:hypothetical protein GGX14DRAFT_661377 [Mycena pura]|uniref:Uncharacterized protein n=1 Tax=Mycena pura TaxID=153505 RepID=A0AAD6V7U7_9AGAR|nr:hypothetical protein GGX14DRAFT_661377 [Mycena pura]
MIEDVDGEIVLFPDSFILRQRYMEDEHNMTLTVPMFKPVPPNYYISVKSDRWLHAESRWPISFKHLDFPEKIPPPTPRLDLQALPLPFTPLYASDENVFLGAPIGGGKTICTEFALLRFWGNSVQSYAVCIEPYQEMADMRVKEWRDKLSQVQGQKETVSFTGETSADLRLRCNHLHTDPVLALWIRISVFNHSRFRPPVFVPSRRQCRLTVDDLPTHYAADDKHDRRFLNAEDGSVLNPHFENISDQGYKQDKHFVQHLFESGAVQMLVASRTAAWSLSDVLQMMSRACRPSEDDRSQQTRKEFQTKIPWRVYLSRHIFRRTSYFLIAVKTIENKQDAMWTCFYRRTTQISNYYNLHNVSYQHLSDHLSELVETMLVDLVNSKSIAVEDEIDVSALNLGMESALAFLFSSKTRQSGARPRAIRLAHVDTNFSFALAAVQFKGLQARPRKHSGGTRVRHARQFQSLRLLRLIRAGGGKSQSSPQRKTKSAYVSRLDALKVLGDIITFRFREFESRDLATARDTQLRTQATSGDDKYAHNRRERRKGAWTAVQLALRDVSFYYKDKTATLPPNEYTGLLELDVNVKVRLISSAEVRASRKYHQAERLEVQIAEDGANTRWCSRCSNPCLICASLGRDCARRCSNPCSTCASTRRSGAHLHGSGRAALAWDTGERATVFADTGGAVLAAAVWLELGSLRRAAPFRDP